MQIIHVVIDCVDPVRLAAFWSAALGYHQAWANDDFVVLAPPSRGPVQVLLQRVPEQKVGKNRVHVDLGTSELEPEIERLVGLGASRGQAYDMEFARWQVMADPEGHEFCVSYAPAGGLP
jgi:catechol 2,3-dioxygenase-like lactoylglutathione lyase family enzyme